MKKLFAIALLILLTACVSPPPVTTPNDVIAQGYVAVEVIAKSVADGQASGSLSGAQAIQLKSQLQEAHDLFDAAAKAPEGSSEANAALSRAQGLLNLAKLYIIHAGDK